MSASGLHVWWDRDLAAGSEFTAVIDAQLLGATVVIVLWSAESVRSSFVRDESSRALKQGKLLPVRIDFDKSEADRHFRAGLDQQYASVPQLEKALNEYLSALERRPAHARAHYYLGHVYAQTGKLIDALDSFKRALAATEAPLDRSQRIDAEKKVQSLARVEGEATPTRLTNQSADSYRG